MTKQIHLGPKKSTLFALVDDEDYEMLMSMGKWHAWNCAGTKNTWYARHTNNDGKVVPMHRQVIGVAPRKMVIDHIDGNGLNNQRSNLRFATWAQNCNNRIYKKRAGHSEYRGLFQAANGKWSARIKIGDVRHFLGNYDTEMDAATAYDAVGKLLLKGFFTPNLSTDDRSDD
jgi:HNH endonuclease